jgi:hypothetical protein
MTCLSELGFRPVNENLTLVANSLCRGRRTHTMCDSELEIVNSF